MSKARRRSINTAQIKMRMLAFKIVAAGGTPVGSGFDRFGLIDPIIDNAVGDYTIFFKAPFERTCQCAGLVVITPDCIGIVSAVAFDRITVKLFDATDGVTAKDGDFFLTVIGSDARYDVE